MSIRPNRLRKIKVFLNCVLAYHACMRYAENGAYLVPQELLNPLTASSGIRRIFQWGGGLVTSHRDDVKYVILLRHHDVTSLAVSV